MPAGTSSLKQQLVSLQETRVHDRNQTHVHKQSPYCVCVTFKEECTIQLHALTAVTGGPAIPGVGAVTVEGAP